MVFDAPSSDSNRGNLVSGFVAGERLRLEKTDPVPIPSPIFYNLSDNGGQVAFKIFQDVLIWADEELSAWGYLAASTQGQKNIPTEEIVLRQLSVAENMIAVATSAINRQIDSKEAEAVVRRCLDAYASLNVVHSNSILGKMAITMERYRPMVLGMLAGATESAPPEAGRSLMKASDSEAFTFGYALALQFRIGSRPENIAGKITGSEVRIDSLLERLEPSEHAIKRMNEEYKTLRSKIDEARNTLDRLNRDALATANEMLEQTQRTLEKNIEGMWAKLEDVQENAVNRINSGTGAKGGKSKSTIDYWHDVSRYHTIKSSQSTTLMIVVGVVAVISEVIIAYGLMRSGVIARGGLDFVAIASLGLPFVVAVFLLLLSAKSQQKHENIANNAQEKVAMIETYESLEAEGAATHEEKIMILKSLFKKHDEDIDSLRK